jgi:hypothetical protein
MLLLTILILLYIQKKVLLCILSDILPKKIMKIGSQNIHCLLVNNTVIFSTLKKLNELKAFKIVKNRLKRKL